MLLYLDHAWDKFQAAGRLKTPADLHDAIIDGAVQRIRPKIMTVCAILFGLLPIMWSPTTQVGADVMKRIAAPMIGGVITSAILELLLYPTIYMLWRRHHLPNPQGPEAPYAIAAPVSSPIRRRGFPWKIVLLLAAVLGVAAFWRAERMRPSTIEAAAAALNTPFATRTANGIKVNFYASGGGLHFANNEVTIEFLDGATGRPIDVGTVNFELNMNMPGMVLNSGSMIAPTGKPGRYRGNIKPDMAGDWTAKLNYEGPRGKRSLSFTLTVTQ
jgi:hypothetical protein